MFFRSWINVRSKIRKVPFLLRKCTKAKRFHSIRFCKEIICLNEHCWIWMSGVQMYINISPSRKQKLKEEWFYSISMKIHTIIGIYEKTIHPTRYINSQIINRVIPLTRKNILLLFFIKSKKYFLPNPIVWKQFMEKIAKCKKVATMRMRSAKTDWQRRFLTFVSSIFVTFRWDTCDL